MGIEVLESNRACILVLSVLPHLLDIIVEAPAAAPLF